MRFERRLRRVARGAASAAVNLGKKLHIRPPAPTERLTRRPRALRRRATDRLLARDIKQLYIACLPGAEIAYCGHPEHHADAHVN